MLNVLTPDEVFELISRVFSSAEKSIEYIGISEALHRTLGEDIRAAEYVPSFNRSTVDGYALKASDSFGCSESIPAILELAGRVDMGITPSFTLKDGQCAYVPTGGEIPDGADCVVMIEYSEDFNDGTIGISKPGAPGLNVIFKGDDVCPGKVILEKGRILTPSDIGALAANGTVSVPVCAKTRVGIISTGDELVDASEVPQGAQIRDVNTPLLSTLFEENGAETVVYGIVSDDRALLEEKMEEAVSHCDMVVISGGSSVGVKDSAAEIIESMGQLLFHGIAMKPGKPTMLGKCSGKPVFGLPGHPVAAYFAARLFALYALDTLEGKRRNKYTVRAYLSENLGANDGRANYIGVRCTSEDGRLIASPIRTKSGLITSLAGSDGYICIERDCEGLPRGAEVEISVF